MSLRYDRYKQGCEALEGLTGNNKVEYDDKQKIIRIQLYGCELVLVDNGKWFIQDTSGG